MGILDSTIYSSSADKNPGDRVLSDFGDLDWAFWGRSAAADFDSKDGASVLQDYVDIGSPTVSRLVGAVATEASCSWTGGTPTATQAGTRALISNTVNTAGFRIDTTALDPTKIYRFVFIVGLNNATADLDISLSESSAPAISTSISSSGVESWEISLVCKVDSATEFLRFDWVKTSGTQNRLQAVYVQDFGYELSLYDTFTDTNGTGIEDHTPDYRRATTEVYEAIGSTTTSSDVTGSGGMSIQSNQLQFTTSAERARFYTGSKDQVIELSWVTSATSGHRIGVSPRHVDKANQYWFNLREPNNDYSFYKQDNDDEPTPQTNLTSGAQDITLDTSAIYHVRASVIGLVMRLELNGELIQELTLSADEIPGADGIAFGVEGVGTNNHFDFVKVWSPPLPIQDASISEAGSSASAFAPVANISVSVSNSANASNVAGSLAASVSNVVANANSNEVMSSLALASASFLDALAAGEQWAVQIAANESFSQFLSASETVSASVATAKSWLESVSTDETFSPAAQSVASFLASVVSAENIVAIVLAISDFSESLSADSSFNPVLQIQENISISGSVSESFFGTVVEIRNLISTVAANENFESLASGVVVYNESANSSVSYSPLIDATQEIVLAATSSGEFSNFSISVRNWSETLSSTYDIIGVAVSNAEISGSTSSLEAFVEAARAIGDLTSNGNSFSVFGAALSVIATFAQSANVSESFASSANVSNSIAEATFSLDNLSAVAAASGWYSESASAQANLNIAADFFESVVFGLEAVQTVFGFASGKAQFSQQLNATAVFSASQTEPGFLVVGAINIVAALLGVPSTGDRHDDSDIF